jgi:hypothetical protein
MTTLRREDLPELVAGVVSKVQRGCFVMRALRHPVPVSGCTVLNGALLA